MAAVPVGDVGKAAGDGHAAGIAGVSQEVTSKRSAGADLLPVSHDCAEAGDPGKIAMIALSVKSCGCCLLWSRNLLTNVTFLI